MLPAQHTSLRPCASIRQARRGWKVAASRGRTVTVHNVFSLSKMLNKTSAGRANAAVSRDASQINQHPSLPSYVSTPHTSCNYLLLDPQAVEVAAPAQAPIHPRKAVQAVPVVDRPAVELLMALTRAAGHPTGALVSGQQCSVISVFHACCTFSFLQQSGQVLLTCDASSCRHIWCGCSTVVQLFCPVVMCCRGLMRHLVMCFHLCLHQPLVGSSGLRWSVGRLQPRLVTPSMASHAVLLLRTQ
jgi:hypothetical protein